MVEVVMQARTPAIGDLIDQCAKKQLAFSGPDSLCAKVHAMGYNTDYLYYMVVAREEELEMERKQQVA